MGLTIEQVCDVAKVARSHYFDLKSGKHAPRASTVMRLQQALLRFKVGFGDEAAALAPVTAFKAVLVLIAFMTKTDAKTAINSNPQRRAVQDKAWADAAHCRQVACHVCNGLFGLRTADIARAAGLTKGAVSLAVSTIETRRDSDAKLDALLDQLEEVFS